MSYQAFKSIKTVTASETLDLFDDTVLVDTTSGDVTLTLPTAASSTGKQYSVTKSAGASNDAIVDPNGAETIGGETSIKLPSIGDRITFQSNGTSWTIVSENIPVVASYETNAG